MSDTQQSNCSFDEAYEAGSEGSLADDDGLWVEQVTRPSITADMIEVLQCIDSYTPRNIELPTKFMFPGAIPYVAAVHGPDPLLCPPTPQPPTVPSKEGKDVRRLNALRPVPSEVPVDDGSMFTNFFHAARASSQTARSPRSHSSIRSPRTAGPVARPARSAPPLPIVPAPPSAREGRLVNPRAGILAPLTPVPPSNPAEQDGEEEEVLVLRSVSIDPLHFLGLLNEGICTRMANQRLPVLVSAIHTPLEAESLYSLLDDPEWVPTRPTRRNMVAEYLEKHKLDRQVITKEKKTAPKNWMTAREYELETVIKSGRGENLSSGAMNHSGTLLATTHFDMTCRVWCVKTGNKLQSLVGHTDHLTDCAWSHPSDELLLTACFDKTVRVWNPHTGTLLRTLIGHELEVMCVAMPANTVSMGASGGTDDLVILWDLHSGEERHSLTGHEGEVVMIDFNPTGSLLASCSMDETVRIWCTVTGVCLQTLRGHSGEVHSVVFNSFGNTVASGSVDGTCRLWDVQTGRSRVLRGHTAAVTDTAMSPDGWLCASGSEDGTIRIWDVLTGGCVMLLAGHKEGICRIMFAGPEGRLLVSSSMDSTVRVWDLDSGDCKQVLKGHKGVVIIGYNAQTDRILSMARDNTCRVWKLEDPHNTLVGMATLLIAQSLPLYNGVREADEIPPLLQAYLEKRRARIEAVPKAA